MKCVICRRSDNPDEEVKGKHRGALVKKLCSLKRSGLNDEFEKALAIVGEEFRSSVDLIIKNACGSNAAPGASS